MRTLISLILFAFLLGCEQIEERAKTATILKTPAITEQTGRFTINPQFSEAYPFREGLAAVRIGDSKTGKWGFIDKQGKMVINPQFDHVTFEGTFSEGLAGVRIGGKWGYISR